MLDELAGLSVRIKRAQRKLGEMEDQRNALVHQALDAGWTQRAIADVTGLAPSRIGQIALQRKDPDGS